MKLFVYSSPLETARALIKHLLGLIDEQPDKIFNIAVSGGNTPARMFELWANEYANVTSWERIRIYWVDERCVPPESVDSNYGMTRKLLLSVVPVSSDHVFRIRGEKNPEEEAERYSELVSGQVPSQNGWPEFDVVLLGAGDDGHTSSIFPGQENLLFSDSVYAVSVHPSTGQQRIALTGYPIMNARHVIFLINGEGKAEVVKDMCKSADAGPAAYIAHHAKNHMALFVDAVAAAYICSSESCNNEEKSS
ncbi:6-phosphogluconolactonase [Bacteroides pyogenes]|uniref:6-phosphogluconolactonase n=1 Tax=Bacteroides pyogenes TaxID=310300 RepID=UPI0011E486D2|nr:6-phosphogluconolactonase [Bacteroides pyogenes]MBR8708752.1 6-phosphogluconolactonase [Bacteroides pyogenes]MBR8717513.1 6-phosphogluconolactonase [Bacteroides pyogenes]MBR8747051.1 6-phosphogluconolactonase [Bacteroides pyogenes]MBR8757395.1 6-phosphogluconolactonase [Bacteroides pyogenes]MBR8780621.1 6-phosphogluconolactonase [Bacteroides pyogenes]